VQILEQYFAKLIKI